MDTLTTQTRPVGTVVVDAAAENRRFLTRVYGWMSAGLAVTGLVALMVASSETLIRAILLNRFVFYGLLIAELAAVWSFGSIAKRFSSGVAAAAFFTYATLNGLTFSVIFLVYTASSIGGTFFITAGTFGAVSVYGAVTKRDLTGMGSFMFMGLIGIVIASVVNIFLGSEMVSFLLGYIGVIVFTGLTAYDTQKILALNVIGNEGTDEDRKEALSGALILYLDFINLFLSLLRLMGRRK
jgi:FtsH-binding integral membrane protein